MKRKFLRWGAIAVGTALITQALTPLVFAAGAAITVTGAGTTPHSSLSVSGSGFQPGEIVELMFGLSRATTTADGSGSFTGGSLTVPNVPTGNYVIVAIGETSGTAAFAYFYVSSFYPQAAPSVWWTSPGTSVTFSGSGFAPQETILITASGSSTPFAAFPADISGAFSAAGSFTIPYAARNGSISVTVRGESSGVTIPLTIGVGDLYPWANPSSWYVLPGNTVTFMGGGFGPNEGVSIYFGASTTPLVHATADASGNFTSSTSVMIPYGKGVADFRAVGDASGVEADVPITHAAFYPTLSPSAYYSAPGGTIALTGSGFAPNERVDISLGDNATTSAATDGTGAFSISSVHLPAIGGVQIPITAVGATSGATAAFTMTMGAYYTWITLSSYWAPGGSPLTVTGHNFAPGEAVVLGSVGGWQASSTADENGDFSAATTVPYAPAGDVAITAAGAHSNAPASVHMTVAPVWTDVELKSYSGAPGTPIEFVGSGYVPNDVVQVTTDRTGSSTVATIHADASGSFDDSGFVIPHGWTEGNLTLTITGTKSFDAKSIVYYVTGS